VRLTNSHPLGEHLLVNSYVSLKRLEYPDFDYLTGNQYWVGTTLHYGLDPTSAVWTSVSFGRNLARDAPYSYRAVGGVLGYAKELPARFNVQAKVSAYRNVYDEPAPLFGTDRRDQLLQFDLGITARDWDFHGFAPTLMLSAGRNNSTIPLYTYIYAALRWHRHHPGVLGVKQQEDLVRPGCVLPALMSYRRNSGWIQGVPEAT